MSRMLFYASLILAAHLPTVAVAQVAGRLCWIARPDAVLEAGDSLHVRAGIGRAHLLILDTCDGEAAPPVVWRSLTPRTLLAGATGEFHAREPGPYQLAGVAGSDTLRAEGHVLPVGWRMRLSPLEVTIEVGDSIRYVVEVVSRAGETLSLVPFSLYTREFEATVDELPVLLTDVASRQNVIGPVHFRGIRPGETTVRAVVGRQQVVATLHILPAR